MFTTNNKLIICIGFLVTYNANAANIPNSGSLIQEVAPEAIPSETITPPRITELNNGQKLKDETPFPIERILLVGNQTFSTESLETVYQESISNMMTLSQLQQICDLIGEYYHVHGYPLVRAVVPKQTLNNGTVKIQVIEPKLESTSTNNPSNRNTRLINETLGGLAIDKNIRDSELERTLLLLSDLPGTEIEASLKPGGQPGTTSLQIDVNDTLKVRSLVKLSNHGGESLNRERLTGIVQIQNPFNIGDQLDLSVITSGEPLGYGAIQYGAIINGQGTRISGGASHLEYKLGKDLKSLDAHGDVTTAYASISHPFIRSYDNNVNGQLTFNYNQFNDLIDSTNTENDRDINTVALSFSGRHNGAFSPQGKSYWSTTLINGKLDINNAASLTQDRLTSNAQGSFSALKFSFDHIEPISNDSSVTFSFDAQQANTNLDSSQKIVLGGPNSIRAYDSSAVSGDTGYSASLSYQHTLARGSFGPVPGQVFADAGSVKLNKKPWGNASSNNSLSIKGAGVGVNWYAPDQWRVKFLVASKVGDKPDELNDVDSSRAWFEISKEFAH